MTIEAAHRATTSEEFVRRLLEKYPATKATGRWAWNDDAVENVWTSVNAGELDAAAIEIVETAPISASELDEFEELVESFDWMDADVARRLLPVARERLI